MEVEYHMMARRCKGFTLIELLVVIAIIGILASMVFPVFARARESARKAVCLSNVKNIALAIQMYLADNNDTFPTREHRQEVIDYFATKPGGGKSSGMSGCEDPAEAGWVANIANPYLNWPVVLDEYVKNRDVWRCPSAILETAAGFIMGGGGDWLGYLQSNEGAWGVTAGPGGTAMGPGCYHSSYPSGWGGVVTDSVMQNQGAGTGDEQPWVSAPHGAFVMSIGTMKENLQDMRLVSISDPVYLPVVADSPPPTDWLSIPRIAYANVCCADCAGAQWGSGCTQSEDGPPIAYCSDDSAVLDCWNTIHVHRTWARDPRRKAASARHLAGTNIGFADGHAAWWSAQGLLAAADEGRFERIGFICEASTGGGGSSVEDYRMMCGGNPPPEMTFLHSESINFYGQPNN
jgi:prepilin-type N-terminal cleavage/methylation domain-containing protein/prepilin-type processing-associated H-X9-DG protein